MLLYYKLIIFKNIILTLPFRCCVGGETCCTLCCQRTVLSITYRRASPSGSQIRIRCKEASSGSTLSRGGFSERLQSGHNHGRPVWMSLNPGTQPLW